MPPIPEGAVGKAAVNENQRRFAGSACGIDYCDAVVRMAGLSFHIH
jgi:hypothetical protein